MKEVTAKHLEAYRPDVSPGAAFDHCLRALYADKAHWLSDEACHELTYEELIGALLLARDVLAELERETEEATP
jgi:hypothetical protein